MLKGVGTGLETNFSKLKCITSNHRQIQPPSYPMTFLVPNILEVLIDKIALWISIRGNDWTAESAITSSNEENLSQNKFTRSFHLGVTQTSSSRICVLWSSHSAHLAKTLYFLLRFITI